MNKDRRYKHTPRVHKTVKTRGVPYGTSPNTRISDAKNREWVHQYGLMWTTASLSAVGSRPGRPEGRVLRHAHDIFKGAVR